MNSLQEAMKKAQGKKEAKETTPPGQLLDLTCLGKEAEKASVSNTEEEARQAQENKKWAEQGGALMYQSEKEIEKINQIPDAEFSPELRAKKQKHEEIIKKISSFAEKDPNLKSHVEFSRLWAMLGDISDNQTSRGAILNLLMEIKKWGRFYTPDSEEVKSYRKANSGHLPDCSFGFEGKTRFPSCENGNAVSSAQWNVRKKMKEIIRKYDHSEISIMAKANNNLSGFKAGEISKYYFFLPAGEDKKTGRKHGEGHLVLEVVDINAKEKGKDSFLVVRFDRALGSLNWVQKDSQNSRDFRLKKGMPFFWFKNGRPSDSENKRLSDTDFRLASAIVWRINGMLEKWEREAEKQSGKRAEPDAKKTAEKTPTKDPATKPATKPTKAAKKTKPKKKTQPQTAAATA